MTEKIMSRKADHINVCLNERVSPDHCYWDDIRLIHNAMPELDLDDIDMRADVLGAKLEFPLVVTAITGGFPEARTINANIAQACAELGIGMGVGSERAGVNGIDPESYAVVKDYDVPLVIGNVGAPQLVKQKSKDMFTDELVGKAMELVDADYVAVHLNFLQEVVQPEGDTNGAGIRDRIRDLALKYPVIVKETGAGIDRSTAQRLGGIGVRGLDVSGTGGTSFSAVEMYRADSERDALHTAIGNTFFDWGIPAPAALMESKVSKLPLIASGGILDGTHVAAAVSMGACAGGVARAVLKEATESAEAVKAKLTIIREELRTAMMLTGCRNVAELSKARKIVLGATAEWIRALEEED